MNRHTDTQVQTDTHRHRDTRHRHIHTQTHTNVQQQRHTQTDARTLGGKFGYNSLKRFNSLKRICVSTILTRRNSEENSLQFLKHCTVGITKLHRKLATAPYSNKTSPLGLLIFSAGQKSFVCLPCFNFLSTFFLLLFLSVFSQVDIFLRRAVKAPGQ